MAVLHQLLLTILISIYQISAAPTGSYEVVGNRVMYNDGSGSLTHVTFNGIGTTCYVEYRLFLYFVTCNKTTI